LMNRAKCDLLRGPAQRPGTPYFGTSENAHLPGTGDASMFVKASKWKI
jgi:hypothetical protein